MKKCGLCGTEKPLAEFYKRKDSPDGYRNDCKQCRRTTSLKTYYSDVEVGKAKLRAAHAKRLANNPNFYAEKYAANREKSLMEAAKYYKKFSKERVAKAVAWAKANKGLANANKKAYKAQKAKALPVWAKANSDYMWMMQEAYTLAKLREKMFGFSWHVDHKIPLRGESVSGLHVPWNLQVIPGAENMSKSNKFVGGA